MGLGSVRVGVRGWVRVEVWVKGWGKGWARVAVRVRGRGRVRDRFALALPSSEGCLGRCCVGYRACRWLPGSWLARSVTPRGEAAWGR